MLRRVRRWLPVLDRELQRLRAVDIRSPPSAIDRFDARRQRVPRSPKAACRRTRERAALRAQLEMLAADHALLRDLELVAEARRRKTLAPDLARRAARAVSSVRSRGSSAPSVSMTRSRSAGVSERAHRLLERRAEAVEIGLAQRQTRRRRVTAELEHQARDRAWRPGRARRAGAAPGIERPEPLISPSLPRAKAIDRPVKALLDARGDDADHALVPAGIEEAEAAGVVRRHAVRAPRARLPACRLRSRGARG